MKRISHLAILSALLLLCGCQKSKLELSPIPQDPITGDLSNYFSMPGQPIVVDFKSATGSFTVDLECTSPLPKDSEVKLGYELIDDKGNVILRTKSSVKPASDESIDQIKNAAKNDEVTVTFSLPSQETNIDKAKYLRIESKVNFNDPVVPDTNGVAGAKKPRLSNVGLTHDYSDYVCYSRLTDEDLCHLSPSELRVLRNTIYARHGRKFKSPDLQRYFGGFSWYQPLYNEISPASLTEIEKHNIALIQKYE